MSYTTLLGSGVTCQWGCPQTLAPQGGILQNYSENHTASEKELPDAFGTAVALTLYNKKVEVSFSVYASTPVSKPGIGTMITATGGTIDGKNIVCKTATVAWSNEDYTRIDVTGTMYKEIQSDATMSTQQSTEPPPQGE